MTLRYGLLLLASLLLALLDGAPVHAQTLCREGAAGAYPCRDVDLMAHLGIAELGGVAGTRVNDIWGWTDPETGTEYALVGLSDGTAFVDLSDPAAPVYLGTLLSHTGQASSWRDVKTYQNYAVVVAGMVGHGVQVFDLTELRGVTTPQTFTETAHYDRIGSVHNVFVNEATGYAYAVGASTGTETCGGGLHMIDLRDPLAPTFAGCFADPSTGRSGTGYTHDVQCVVYRGPDPDYQGREICFGSNETAVSMADVTDKDAPVAIATATYPTAEYIHQGWLTEDHRYFIQGDELDERNGQVGQTRTYVWDLTDLDDPRLLTTYSASTTAIDHNLFVVGARVYQANYTAGLRILDISDIANPQEVAFFDTTPTSEAQTFAGTWGAYPFYESGLVAMSDMNEGLFVLRPVWAVAGTREVPQREDAAVDAYPNPFGASASVEVQVPATQTVRVTVYDALGRPVATLFDGTMVAGRLHTLSLGARDLPAGVYAVRVEGEAFEQTRMLTRAR